mmetsp:Transcript_46308/g.91305  ORF Transcript_46308/g.91305 Transcript_46308/m.91305 type:complete len:94 (+) Transcript_46308:354-635(+)
MLIVLSTAASPSLRLCVCMSVEVVRVCGCVRADLTEKRERQYRRFDLSRFPSLVSGDFMFLLGVPCESCSLHVWLNLCWWNGMNPARPTEEQN